MIQKKMTKIKEEDLHMMPFMEKIQHSRKFMMKGLFL